MGSRSRFSLLLLFLLLPAWAKATIPQELWVKTWTWARAFGLDPYLLAALVYVESGYRPEALSPKGALGLGQFMPETWKGVTGAPLHYRLDPDWSLWAAARYLRDLYHRFQSWEKALAAYHAGPSRAHNPPPSTRTYVRRVLSLWQYFRSQAPP